MICIFISGFKKNDKKFRNNKNKNIIKLDSNIEEIPGGSFDGCSSLMKITIPSSVKKIDSDVFNGIKSLEILCDLKITPKCMFKGCTSLTQVSILPSVTLIEKKHFLNQKLKVLQLHQKLKILMEYLILCAI